MNCQGKLYRALNPIYAREPLSGRGAEINGDRFKPKGTAALYLATPFQTAIKEANQVGDLQPTTMVSYEANIDDILGGRNPAKLENFEMSLSGLANPTWRDQIKALRRLILKSFPRPLISQGGNGVLVANFARGTTDSDINLVVWKWADGPRSENHSHRRQGTVSVDMSIRLARREVAARPSGQREEPHWTLCCEA